MMSSWYCPVCGAPGGACQVIPAQHPVDLAPRKEQPGGALAQYRDPATGFLWSVTAAEAARLGYVLVGPE